MKRIVIQIVACMALVLGFGLWLEAKVKHKPGHKKMCVACHVKGKKFDLKKHKHMYKLASASGKKALDDVKNPAACNACHSIVSGKDNPILVAKGPGATCMKKCHKNK